VSPRYILECCRTQHHAASNNTSWKFKFLATALAKIRFWLWAAYCQGKPPSQKRFASDVNAWVWKDAQSESLEDVVDSPANLCSQFQQEKTGQLGTFVGIPLTGSPWKINDRYTGKFFVGIKAVKLTSQKEHKLVPKWILSLLSSLWIEYTLGSCFLQSFCSISVYVWICEYLTLIFWLCCYYYYYYYYVTHGNYK
jgi:hypothetical protein